MMKLLFGRLLPAGAAAAILTSALSPLRPALDAFGAAAVALTGQDPAPVEGGADFGAGLVPGLPSAPPQAKPQAQRKKLQELANRLRDPNAPKLKEFQAPGRAQSAPRAAPALRRPVMRSPLRDAVPENSTLGPTPRRASPESVRGAACSEGQEARVPLAAPQTGRAVLPPVPRALCCLSFCGSKEDP